MINKKVQGKKNRAAGQRFEAKVRRDLTEKGWIVSKWMNTVKLSPKYCGMIPAKHKFRGVGIPMAIGTGFPDFIAFRRVMGWHYLAREIIGVECKSNGYLTKEEKEKCEWLLKNKVFSKILIASKGNKRGEIIYKDFKELKGGNKKRCQ